MMHIPSTGYLLRLIALFAVLMIGSAALARIEVLAPFDEAEFAQAQQGDKIIIVESYAGWCLACKIQAPMLAKLRQEPEYRGLRLFKIGEYTPKAIWKRFRLKAYGVLILYRGKAEIGRLSGAKSEAELRAFIKKADAPWGPKQTKS